MPWRSTVSANTVCGSSPETKVLEQTVWATKPVATRIARSGRKANPKATSAMRFARIKPATSFRDIRIIERYSRLESVEPGRIVDQDFLAGGGVGRPHRQLVEQAAVVDLEQRRHVG